MLPEFDQDDYSGSDPAPSHELFVPLSLAGSRADLVLASLLPEFSRSRLQVWLREGRVLCDGKALLDPKKRLSGGELLLVSEAPAEDAGSYEPEEMALDIVFEDEHLLVINKPAGLVVHPGSGNWDGTLLNGVLAHVPEAKGLPRAGIVHRLDKETSGLMVVAKTLQAQTDLVRQLQDRSVKRLYAAVVIGQPAALGIVDAPIGRHPTQRTRMAVVASGRPSRTHFRVIERFRDTAWVECSLETGRTHQIRVHMTHLGFPLVGDPVYRGRRAQPRGAEGFNRQALHAFSLGLLHPATGRSMLWERPLADDLAALMDSLRAAPT